jgi:hypothetical protein
MSDRRRIAGLVRQARQLKLDWMHPPAPVNFDMRLALLMAPYSAGNKRGRPARRSQVVEDPGQVALWA